MVNGIKIVHPLTKYLCLEKELLGVRLFIIARIKNILCQISQELMAKWKYNYL